MRDDDAGFNEVVGFLFTFIISAIILVVSTQAFMRSKDSTGEIVNGVELTGVANRIATRITQAGLFAQEFPNASVTFHVKVDQDLAGKPYKVNAITTKVGSTPVGADVRATLTNGQVTGNATLYRLTQLPFTWVGGLAYSSSEWVNVTSTYQRNVTAGSSPQYREDSHNEFHLISISNNG